MFIEKLEQIRKEKGLTYMDAIIYICEKDNVEIETAAYWIKKDSNIKLQLQAEAVDLNFLKREGSILPI